MGLSCTAGGKHHPCGCMGAIGLCCFVFEKILAGLGMFLDRFGDQVRERDTIIDLILAVV